MFGPQILTPAQIGSAGGNVTRLDGSTHWVPQSEMIGYQANDVSANPGPGSRGYWPEHSRR